MLEWNWKTDSIPDKDLARGSCKFPTTDNHVLKMIPMEASCYAMLKRKFAGIKRVHFHGAGGVGLRCVVAMKQYARNEARQVLATLPFGEDFEQVALVADVDKVPDI